MRFSAYGAHIDSEISLTGLPTVAGKPVSRVKFRSGCVHDVDLTRKSEVEAARGWRNVTSDGGDNPAFHIDGVGDFHLCPWESGICCTPIPGVPTELIRYWLMHFILPVYLLLDPRYDFFHGSAVDVDGGAVAFLANSMGGKSTLANYFYQQGHALLTDEHLGILRGSCFTAVPSVPFVRPYRELEDLGKPVSCFASQPLPLRFIYLLELGDGPARVIPLAGASAAMALAGNRQLILSNRLTSLTKERFSRLVELSSSTPIAKLCIPRDLQRLPEVYETVLSHLGERRDSL